MAKISIVANPKNKKEPGYPLVISPSVRYDKSLTANHKLLYGEIAALCNTGGSCWAHNQYFADVMGVDKRSITRWLKSLSEAGYIRVSDVLTIVVNQTKEPGHYVVIPGSVRHDKSLTANHKLLYGEMAAMCTTGASLWADYKYVTDAMGVDVRSIKRWMLILSEKGYVKIDTGEAS